MNKFKTLTAIFPLQGSVTQTILNKANLFDTDKCNGALALKNALKKALGKKYSIVENVSWGNYSGYISFKTKKGIEEIAITTPEELRFMRIEEPRKVTFILE